jgi:hypothetical protein
MMIAVVRAALPHLPHNVRDKLPHTSRRCQRVRYPRTCMALQPFGLLVPKCPQLQLGAFSFFGRCSGQDVVLNRHG